MRILAEAAKALALLLILTFIAIASFTADPVPLLISII